MINKIKFLKVVFIILSIILIYLVIVEPYIGMANNGDFQRLSQKVGIDYTFNPWDTENYDKAFFHNVVNEFKITEATNNGWFTTFEINVIFSKYIASLCSKTGLYDIRFMGLSNLIFYLSAIGLLLYAISKYSHIYAIFWGIIVLILASDSYIVQYFNSFYTEIGTIIYFIAFFSVLFIYIKSEDSKKIYYWCLEIVLAVLAICVKQQDILCTIPIFVLLYLQGNEIWEHKISIIKRRKITVLSLLIVLFILPIIFLNLLNRGASNTTTYNIVMKDILFLSEKPEEHLTSIGFDKEDVSNLLGNVGKTAFENPQYMEYVDKFSRINEVKILINEPQIIPKLFKQKAEYLFSTMDNGNLGNFTSDMNMPNSKCKAFKIWSNFKQKILFNNIWYYIGMILLILFYSVRQVIKNAKSYFYINEYYILCTLLIMNILQFITVVFGDSSHDDLKHFFAVNVEFDILLISFIFIILTKLLKKLNINLKGFYNNPINLKNN